MVEDVDAVHDLDNDNDNYDCVNVMLSSSTRKDLIYKDYFNMLRPTGNDFLRTYYSTSFPKLSSFWWNTDTMDTRQPRIDLARRVLLSFALWLQCSCYTVNNAISMTMMAMIPTTMAMMALTILMVTALTMTMMAMAQWRAGDMT